MTRDEALEIIKTTATEYEIAQKEVTYQQQRMEGMRQLKAGLLKMFPELADADLTPASVIVVPDRPKGADAAAWVLQNTPGKWFSVQMVVHELDDQGWLPADSENPTNATRTALERLIKSDPEHFKKDTGEKTGRAVYAYKPSTAHPANEVMDEIASNVRTSLGHNRFAGDAPGQ